ncbi:MAG: VWA domain-containing protein [Oligoflexia bacterium]|nr:VWA domain-containing protein [Oligoflexia bacterium]
MIFKIVITLFIVLIALQWSLIFWSKKWIEKYWPIKMKRSYFAGVIFYFLGIGVILYSIYGMFFDIEDKTRMIDYEEKQNYIIIALDISRSMLVKDGIDGFSRIEHGLLLLENFLGELESKQQVAFILFDERIVPHTPFTTDKEYLLRRLDLVKAMATVNYANTNILGVFHEIKEWSSLRIKKNDGLKVVVITDGEDTFKSPMKDVSKFSQILDLNITMIAVGNIYEQKIPVMDSSGNQVAFLRDANGNYLESRLDLKNILEVSRKISNFSFFNLNNENDLKVLSRKIAASTTGAMSDISNAQAKDGDYKYYFIIGIFFFIVRYFLLATGVFIKKSRSMATFLGVSLLLLLSFTGVDSYSKEAQAYILVKCGVGDLKSKQCRCNSDWLKKIEQLKRNDLLVRDERLTLAYCLMAEGRYNESYKLYRETLDLSSAKDNEYLHVFNMATEALIVGDFNIGVKLYKNLLEVIEVDQKYADIYREYLRNSRDNVVFYLKNHQQKNATSQIGDRIDYSQIKRNNFYENIRRYKKNGGARQDYYGY